MTPHQKDSLHLVLNSLSEHFDSALIIVSSDSDDLSSEVQCAYHGSFPNAIGLADLAKVNIYKHALASNAKHP